MSLPDFSVKNQVLVNVLMVVILVAGAIFAFTLVREMFPESRPNRLSITAVYPGVQPQEIEKAVTIKIEEAVRGIEGIEKVESAVREGVSSTTLILFNEVKDVDAVLQEVKNEIDALQDLPDEIEQITLKKLEPKLPVISVAVYGDGDEADRKRAARRLRDDLLLLPGVTDVQISGTREDEISVEVRPERLLEYDITFDEVAQAISQTNLDISGGELKGARTTISVRTLGEELRGRDLEKIIVRSQPDGRQIYLRDLAAIRDTFVETDLEAYFNGKPAMNVIVYNARGEDVIQIASLVKAFIAGKKGEPFDPHGFDAAYEQPWYRRPFSLAGSGISWTLDRVLGRLTGRPDLMKVYEQSRAAPFDHNFQFDMHTDLARFVEGRLDLMVRNGRSGLILVVLSLMLFLNWRVAFWAAVGLPVSFLGTFVAMWALGATINLLSLFGLIVVLGIIVDDAIVIGENIYRHAEEGMPPLRAAVKGAEEVMWPVIVAVSTTIAAFAPLFFIRGQIGDFMRVLPVVVLAALTVSLIEALVILPAHLAHLPSKKEKERRAAGVRTYGRVRSAANRLRLMQENFVHGFLGSYYERFLRYALRWRYVTLAVALALLMVAGGMLAGGIVERVFIQQMDSETLICFVEMPVGTTSDQVKERLDRLAAHVLKRPEVVSVQSFVALQFDVGGAGVLGARQQSHLGQLIIELKPADVRETFGEESSQALLSDFRRFSAALAGVNSVTWEAMSGGPGGKEIHIRVSGRDFKENLLVAEKLKQELAGYEGVFDLDDDFDRGKREVRLRLREAARPTGITVAALGGHVRAALYGREARRITRDREDVKIMVRYPERFRENVYNLESMWIPTPAGGSSGVGQAASLPREGQAGNSNGQGGGSSGQAGSLTSNGRGWVPLGEVAELTEAEGYTTINRSEFERAVAVFGEVDEESDAEPSEILEKVRETFEATIAREHPGVRIEFLGQFEEMTKAFGGLKMALPVALLLIYLMLAGLFRSYFQPIVVMAAIPFGFFGAVVGHWVTGNPMTILSWIGLVALTGIVVNDSLVLVDFINKRVRSGMGEFEASIEGARLRLRAILLTTVTTVAGLTPLMFETSFQAKFLIPMAVTLTFGLIFATALTLLIVPTLNMIFFDVRRFVAGEEAVERDDDVLE